MSNLINYLIVWGSETWKWLRQFLQNGCLYQCWTGIKNVLEYYLSIIWVSLFNLTRYHFEWYPDWKPDHRFSGMKLLRGLVVDLSIDDALQWCSCFFLLLPTLKWRSLLHLHKFPIVAEIVVGAVCILSGIAVVSTLACNGDVLFVDLPSCKYENSYGKIRACFGGEETALAEK